MRIRRSTMAAIVLAALMTFAVACGDDDTPAAEPSNSASQSPTTSAPTTTAPAWEAKYSDEQIAAYDAALERWTEFETRSEPFWSGGKATRAAQDFFKEYLPSPKWQGYYQRLQAYEQAGVTLEGRPKVLWSKPKNIAKNALTVVIQQCVDYTRLTGSQDGKPIARDPWAEVPRLQTIALSKPKGHNWLVYDVQDSTSEERPPRCTP